MFFVIIKEPHMSVFFSERYNSLNAVFYFICPFVYLCVNISLFYYLYSKSRYLAKAKILSLIFFKNILEIFITLHFQMTIIISLLISMKQPHKNYYDSFESMDKFEESWHFYKVNPPIYEHGIFYYLFRILKSF